MKGYRKPIRRLITTMVIVDGHRTYVLLFTMKWPDITRQAWPHARVYSPTLIPKKDDRNLKINRNNRTPQILLPGPPFNVLIRWTWVHTHRATFPNLEGEAGKLLTTTALISRNSQLLEKYLDKPCGGRASVLLPLQASERTNRSPLPSSGVKGLVRLGWLWYISIQYSH